LISLRKIVVYPEKAWKECIEGKVVVCFLVGKDGKPIKAIIEKSVTNELDQAAIEAVMKTEFIPGIQKNKPV